MSSQAFVQTAAATGECSLDVPIPSKLLLTQYVKAYIKRNKHDAADAEAICEAVQRPTMRFVPVKTAEQQATQLLHRGREQLVRQRTMLVNALRAHLAEFGLSEMKITLMVRRDLCHIL